MAPLSFEISPLLGEQSNHWPFSWQTPSKGTPCCRTRGDEVVPFACDSGQHVVTAIVLCGMLVQTRRHQAVTLALNIGPPSQFSDRRP